MSQSITPYKNNKMKLQRLYDYKSYEELSREVYTLCNNEFQN